jgi:hypothetical protein
MRIPKALVFLLLTIPVSFASVAKAADANLSATLAKNRFVEAELALAQKSRIYAIFDFDKSQILLKARGVAFKTWKIESFRAIRAGVPLKVITITERSTLTPPSRAVLKPENEEAAAPATPAAAPPAGTPAPTPPSPPKLEALEVTDMPTKYQFRCSDNVRISVAPPVTDPWEKRKLMAKEAVEYAALPIKTLLGKAEDKGPLEVELILAPADAQAVYWALPETTEILFWKTPGT